MSVEDQIAKIAQGFGQGVTNYMGVKENQRQRSLQEEALVRQRAVEAATVANQVATSTGKAADFGIINQALSTGDMGLLSEHLKTAPRTQKSELELANAALEAEYKRSQIGKNNRYRPGGATANKPPKLAPEKEVVVKSLGKKTADATYIANSLDEFLKNSEGYTSEQFITQGKQLIKTINSTLGPDATGAEEVKRLGSNLEFAYGNLFSDNPLQLGRDLPGFKQQVKDTVAIMRGAVRRNKEETDRIYGRPVGDYSTPGTPENTTGVLDRQRITEQQGQSQLPQAVAGIPAQNLMQMSQEQRNQLRQELIAKKQQLQRGAMVGGR